jgi:potassium-dependent mechanosensitive channel
VFLPLPVTVLIAALSSLLIAFLLVRLVRTTFEPQYVAVSTDPATASDADRPPVPISRYAPRWLKLPILIAALLIIGAVALGYVALGRFVVEQLIAAGSVLALVMLMHLAIRAILGAPGSGVKPLQTILSERAGLNEDQGNAVVSGLTLLLDGVLALVALPVILLTWGYTILESWSWLKSAIFGFEVGQFKISFARIVLAVLLFLALIFLTRLIQRWLKSGVLEKAKIDHGIANSIHTAVGYAGFTLAALVAVSYGGLDITNFAIVAGALSVGIGFGLQSIVSNFVSGLILLVERPIKVGDWVSVKGQEGYVRRIAVRSTEIETSDRASLIVPNSDLITSTVTNWTHRNALGRVVIPVSVPFNNDPDRVRAILLKVAIDSKHIMQHPTPTVAFEDMDGELKFSLRAVIPDVSRLTFVQTELRSTLLKTLRAENILPAVGTGTVPSQAVAVAIPVKVAFANDPGHIRSILDRIVKANPLVAREPAPSVTFDAMDGGLAFTVHATALDSANAAAMQTELRTGILSTLRAEGIDMSPNATHDIYLRDLDGVKAVLARIMEERMQKTGSSTEPEPTDPASTGPAPLHTAAAKPNKD